MTATQPLKLWALQRCARWDSPQMFCHDIPKAVVTSSDSFARLEYVDLCVRPGVSLDPFLFSLCVSLSLSLSLCLSHSPSLSLSLSLPLSLSLTLLLLLSLSPFLSFFCSLSLSLILSLSCLSLPFPFSYLPIRFYVG